MRDKDIAPDPQLMESMRAVGYTLETAVADIIDNSITAKADEVDIRFTASPEARIAVIDNGAGMSEDELLLAMRLAGRPPSSARHPHDLGRFGLGLKTASLSQARSLTVATKEATGLRAVRWDLDHLAATRKWALQILDHGEISRIPWIEDLRAMSSGTLVLWEKLDQLHAAPELVEAQLDEQMQSVRLHLALVFHRFTGSVIRPLDGRLSLRINGVKVPEIDPYLTHHKGTQEGKAERIRVDQEWVNVQPFTLPYISKLSAADKRTAQVRGTLRDSQGFYVYRAGRLVLWGTWFRLLPRDELGKLARVQVDIPNSLDQLWALDIKKSAAAPPPVVRRRLAQIAGQIVRPSERVHRFRGRPIGSDRVERLWILIADRDTFRYEINRGHPLVTALFADLDPLEQTALANLLRAVEATFPVEDAYNRMGSDNSHAPSPVDPTELIELVRAFHASGDGTVDELVQRLALVEPFTRIQDLETFLREVIDE